MLRQLIQSIPYLIPAVGLHSSHDTADGVGQAVEGRDSGGVDQLVGDLLEGGDGGRAFAADSDRRVPGGVDRLEGILYLVEPPLGREDGDVMVEAGTRTSRHGWTRSTLTSGLKQ